MNKRRVDRKVLKEKRRNRRMCPFKEKTLLRDFIDKESYKDLTKLLETLRPFLMDDEVELYNCNRLYFDLKKIERRHKIVISAIAVFLNEVNKKRTLRYPTSVFFRYLSSTEHCNLGISEKSLKALVYKAIQEIV